MPTPIDFNAFHTGTPVWRIRSDYVLNAPARVIPDTVLCMDEKNHRLVTRDFPEETTAFRMDDAKDGYLYMTEPVSHASWLLFQKKQDADAYLERQELLRQVWEATRPHKRLRECSTAQLRELLRILNHPENSACS